MNDQVATAPGGPAADLGPLFGLVRAECDLAVKATNALSAYVDTGGKEAAERVRALEREADSVRASGSAALRNQFASSPLREDVHRALNRMHEIVHYAATSIREMEVLKVHKDEHLRTMAAQIRTGTMALERGFSKLAQGTTDVTAEVEAARESERDAEEAYRAALGVLFDPRAFIHALDTREHSADTQFLGTYLRRGHEDRHGAAATALAHVVDMFRKREILRHLSNAADRVLYASDILDELAADTAEEMG